MKKYHRKTVKFITASLKRLQKVVEDKDLPELHRLAVDLHTSLPENIVHENSPVLLGGLRVIKEQDIAAYAETLSARLEIINAEYRKKAGMDSDSTPE